MKKTLLFLIAATAMMMTGCSNDDFGGATQGMTLNATVEQPASRATMAEGEKSTYKFSFTDNGNDKLNVTNSHVSNSEVSTYYTFTNRAILSPLPMPSALLRLPTGTPISLATLST